MDANSRISTLDYHTKTQLGNIAGTVKTINPLEDEVRKSLEQIGIRNIRTAFENGAYDRLFTNAQNTLDFCKGIVTNKSLGYSHNLTELMNASIGISLTWMKMEMEKHEICDQRFISLIKEYIVLRELIERSYLSSWGIDYVDRVTTPPQLQNQS